MGRTQWVQDVTARLYTTWNVKNRCFGVCVGFLIGLPTICHRNLRPSWVFDHDRDDITIDDVGEER